MEIRVGDIVQINHGTVVFSFRDVVSKKLEHFNIPPYGIVTEKKIMTKL